MSSNQQSSGRVRDLSQHFDNLAQTEDHTVRSSPTETAEAATEPEARKTIFTGEYRFPLRDRLRAMRKAISDSQEKRGKTRPSPSDAKDVTLNPVYSNARAPSPLDLNCVPLPLTRITPPPPPPPSTPHHPSPLPLDSICPGAPVKSKKYLKLPADLSGTDSDDILFDRRANPCTPVSVAATARRTSDKNNERSRSRTTTPSCPSPLRSSFNAEEMADLAAQLDVMRAEIAAKEAEDPQLTPDLSARFAR
ncbi:hypothetical protein F5B19DRAFT_345741 [Rostrohypoxylon terebratum]|nr:hypothetical protein F5B19DRAFT_345741 [Rostrohypoxylon terebratum]